MRIGRPGMAVLVVVGAGQAARRAPEHPLVGDHRARSSQYAVDGVATPVRLNASTSSNSACGTSTVRTNRSAPNPVDFLWPLSNGTHHGAAASTGPPSTTRWRAANACSMQSRKCPRTSGRGGSGPARTRDGGCRRRSRRPRARRPRWWARPRARERLREIRWPRRSTRGPVHRFEHGVPQYHQPPFASRVGVVEVSASTRGSRRARPRRRADRTSVSAPVRSRSRRRASAHECRRVAAPLCPEPGGVLVRTPRRPRCRRRSAHEAPPGPPEAHDSPGDCPSRRTAIRSASAGRRDPRARGDVRRRTSSRGTWLTLGKCPATRGARSGSAVDLRDRAPLRCVSRPGTRINREQSATNTGVSDRCDDTDQEQSLAGTSRECDTDLEMTDPLAIRSRLVGATARSPPWRG